MGDTPTDNDRPEREGEAMRDDSGSTTSPNASAGAGVSGTEAGEAAGATTAGTGASTDPNAMHKMRKGPGPPFDGRRHLSCENCRIRKMRCSRTSPCLSCKMRGDECVWVGAAPNGTANEDEVEATQSEVNRLKKLVDLLLTRLEQQDNELERYFPTPHRVPSSSQSQSQSQSQSSRAPRVPPPYDPRRPHPDSSTRTSGGSGRSYGDIVVEQRSGESRGPEYSRSHHATASTSRDLGWNGETEPTNPGPPNGHHSQYR
ncbi:hypothetical protein JCM11491_002424 [Sporobolomyces phaffii]